jgi:hypothetical protein
MKHENELTHKEQDQLAAEQRQTQSSSSLEFASVEEMLRHDALHTPVPPTIEHRLAESVRDLPPPPARGWWRRFFGG